LVGLARVAVGPFAGAAPPGVAAGAYSVKRSTSDAPLTPRASDQDASTKLTLTVTPPAPAAWTAVLKASVIVIGYR
jgi:hypothetical protein